MKSKYTIAICVLPIMIMSCCNKNNNTLQNSSSVNTSEKELKEEYPVCDFVFDGTYSEWMFFSMLSNSYFPLTSLDTILNKNREGYVNRYLVRRNDWLILVEVKETHRILNEFPLIPLTYKANDDKKLKQNLTNLFPSPELCCCDLDIKYSKKEEDKYQVIISLHKYLCHISLKEYYCEYKIDISYREGIYKFESNCDNTRIW